METATELTQLVELTDRGYAAWIESLPEWVHMWPIQGGSNPLTEWVNSVLPRTANSTYAVNEAQVGFFVNGIEESHVPTPEWMRDYLVCLVCLLHRGGLNKEQLIESVEWMSHPSALVMRATDRWLRLVQKVWGEENWVVVAMQGRFCPMRLDETGNSPVSLYSRDGLRGPTLRVLPCYIEDEEGVRPVTREEVFVGSWGCGLNKDEFGLRLIESFSSLGEALEYVYSQEYVRVPAKEVILGDRLAWSQPLRDGVVTQKSLCAPKEEPRLRLLVQVKGNDPIRLHEPHSILSVNVGRGEATLALNYSRDEEVFVRRWSLPVLLEGVIGESLRRASAEQTDPETAKWLALAEAYHAAVKQGECFSISQLTLHFASVVDAMMRQFPFFRTWRPTGSKRAGANRRGVEHQREDAPQSHNQAQDQHARTKGDLAAAIHESMLAALSPRAVEDESAYRKGKKEEVFLSSAAYGAALVQQCTPVKAWGVRVGDLMPWVQGVWLPVRGNHPLFWEKGYRRISFTLALHVLSSLGHSIRSTADIKIDEVNVLDDTISLYMDVQDDNTLLVFSRERSVEPSEHA